VSLTFHLQNAEATGSSHGRVQTGTLPTALMTATGWNVGSLATGNRRVMAWGAVQARTPGQWSTGDVLGAPGSDDCLRTEAKRSGTFAAGTHTLSFRVSASGGTNSAGTHTGRIRFRIFRSANDDGSSATEITSDVGITGTSGALSATAQTITAAVSLPAFEVTDEYLFVQVAWETIVAGNHNNRDARLHLGVATTLTTTAFTIAPVIRSGGFVQAAQAGATFAGEAVFPEGLDAPVLLTAEPVSASRVDLTWQKSTGATGYRVERRLITT